MNIQTMSLNSLNLLWVIHTINDGIWMTLIISHYWVIYTRTNTIYTNKNTDINKIPILQQKRNLIISIVIVDVPDTFWWNLIVHLLVQQFEQCFVVAAVVNLVFDQAPVGLELYSLDDHHFQFVNDHEAVVLVWQIHLAEIMLNEYNLRKK